MRVAITGGVGEGKSTVLQFVADLGFAVASADAIAREVFSQPQVHSQIALAAGLTPPVAPADLRRVIASSPEIRRAVNRITHPRIHAAILSSPAQFLEIPLLIEACVYAQFECVWVVTCGAREQRRRLLARYGDASAVEAILGAQLPTRAKIAFANRVIRTNQPPGHVRGVVSEAVAELGF